MPGVIFWTIFIIQFMIWVFLSTTKIGRVIAFIWGTMPFLALYLKYTGYFPTIFENPDVNLFANLLSNFVVEWSYLVVQTTVPSWIGLLFGLKLSGNNDTPQII
ncbi:TPA: hypothetical protein HA335_03485 [Methanocaldococcus jannaschii]|uniref:Uncharacterized protein MJ0131 n=2 Tax=Methanocaldococcus jannaschii TaxID=2190 RepID=Y131_METJA|nr:hypothetical protein [Methanocaldococcus jannaschii]Q57595.1 RecName: Full=Uncharacterized protein MJ0131 [Methanocaldococcus jannaschii DSM 2661]AAB98119.1 hypothetical protein MJ_0131 [Methanocaldococcus jannaschii DSM 2661]HII59633.1 hypothetical protein [Methanocaldococcus jannaschii]